MPDKISEIRTERIDQEVYQDSGGNINKIVIRDKEGKQLSENRYVYNPEGKLAGRIEQISDGPFQLTTYTYHNLDAYKSVVLAATYVIEKNEWMIAGEIPAILHLPDPPRERISMRLLPHEVGKEQIDPLPRDIQTYEMPYSYNVEIQTVAPRAKDWQYWVDFRGNIYPLKEGHKGEMPKPIFDVSTLPSFEVPIIVRDIPVPQ